MRRSKPMVRFAARVDDDFRLIGAVVGALPSRGLPRGAQHSSPCHLRQRTVNYALELGGQERRHRLLVPAAHPARAQVHSSRFTGQKLRTHRRLAHCGLRSVGTGRAVDNNPRRYGNGRLESVQSAEDTQSPAVVAASWTASVPSGPEKSASPQAKPADPWRARSRTAVEEGGGAGSHGR